MSKVDRVGFTLIAVVAVTAMLGMGAYAQDNPYRALDSWAQLPDGKEWGQVPDVYPDAEGNIYVFHRCWSNTCLGSDVDPIFKFDKSGKLLKSFGAGMFVWPHAINLDKDGNLWVTDARCIPADPEDRQSPCLSPEKGGKGHQIFKLSPDGEVLMTLGTRGVAGEGDYVFDQPSDVLIAPNGDIFVVDGHSSVGNNRVVKYSSDGKFIKEWGKTGSEAGEFRDPHVLAMDSQGRLFVADRGNSRIQIFDLEGKHLATWTQFGRPSGLFITADDTMYVADSESNATRNPGWKRGIRIGSAKDGWVTAFIPDLSGMNPDDSWTSGAEGVAADDEGNIYGAEVGSTTLRKYVKK